MLRTERQQQRILRRRRLQLEIELPAEALAQRERPRLVDAAAERRVQHELHAARLVEEALEDERLLRRHDTQRGPAFEEIAGGLFRAAATESRLSFEKRGGGIPIEIGTEIRDGARELVAASRCLTEPERDRRRRAMRIAHTNAS